ncbi:TPA: recombinase family protein [Bacillus cereus]|nr:recombinase family protein [Bacillus cereus]
MNNRKFGYIRVSSKDQNEGRQLEAMKQVGIDERDIFIDKQSGKDFNRQKYQLVKMMLREGDILYVQSLDRFGLKAEITPVFITAYDIWKTGEITAVEAIEKANVPKTTFYRLVQKYEAQLTK